MARNLTAKAEIEINAPVEIVWDILVNPKKINRYMFGPNSHKDRKVGSDIFWKRELRGREFEDEGRFLEFNESRRISYTHYSQLLGEEDIPENYRTVTVDVSGDDERTKVTLEQDGCRDEFQREEFEMKWQTILQNLKDLLED